MLVQDTKKSQPKQTYDAPTAVQRTELVNQYASLKNQISEGYEEARKSGKKFFVLVGESHDSSRFFSLM